MPENSVEAGLQLPMQEDGPPPVDAKFIIEVQKREIDDKNDNRIYLMALLNQREAEFKLAHETWELERQSLMARIEELQSKKA